MAYLVELGSLYRFKALSCCSNFILSNGGVTGRFEMIRETNYSYPGVENFIEVRVTTQYEEEDLKRTRVCQVGNEARNERGITVQADTDTPRTVNITVRIPGHLRSHRDISTDLPLFSHDITGDFADWWSRTYFRDLRFKSTNASIRYNAGLLAKSAFIQISDGQVQGEFSGNQLHVQTSNSPIMIEAIAWMDGLGAGSEITLSTSHGTIQGFLGVSNSMVNTTLKVNVRTSYAAVRLDTDPFESISVNSTLIVDVYTSEAPVSVYLHPAYEGTFDLQTTEAQANVDEDQDVVDPSGMARQRTLQRIVEGSHVQVRGNIYWSYNGDPSDEGMNRGSVNVRNSKSNITMYC
ncbi:hypothetical protein B0H11DRAFT_2286058 [Mycena galericulata]|nr:hypothetical protein B0H11DRAFT_2286058 [Mycena galericulata]